jgi:transposase-like protein
VPPPSTAISMPPPDWLFQQAEQEPDVRTLSAYVDSIHMLREKGFSYREIADWLSERGVDADHNAVYRVYTNSLSGYDAHLEDLRDAEDAQAEARRNS